MFLLINKNMGLVCFFYSLSFMFLISMETWAMKWASLELNAICFATLLSGVPHNQKSENSLSYYLMQSLSSFIILMSLVNTFLAKDMPNTSIFLLFALLFKMATAPLHVWLIPISLACSWNLLLLINTFQKLMPILLLDAYGLKLNLIILTMCVISALTGSTLNFSAKALKKILIFSGISSSAWFLMTISLENYLWQFLFWIYFSNMYFMIQNQSFKMSAPTPLTFLIFLSMGGIPPLLGFFPKMTIICQSLKLELTLTIIALLILSVSDLFIYSRFSMLGMLKSPMKQWKHKIFKNTNFTKFLLFNFTTMTLLLF